MMSNYIKPKRKHFPCRECGKSHTNPSSSTICTPCGEAYYKANLARKAKESEYEKEASSDSEKYLLSLLRKECGLSMLDAAKLLKAFELCMENYNGNQ